MIKQRGCLPRLVEPHKWLLDGLGGGYGASFAALMREVGARHCCAHWLGPGPFLRSWRSTCGRTCLSRPDVEPDAFRSRKEANRPR